MKPARLLFAAAICLLIVQTGAAQVMSGSSTVKRVKAGKKAVVTQTVKSMPDLVIKDEIFIDPNDNNIINGNERAGIRFKVENLGAGSARGVTVKVQLKGSEISGLDFTRAVTVGDIKPGESKEVNIAVYGGMELVTGLAEFKIEVMEDLGFDAYPLEMKINTRPFMSSHVMVADAVFSTEAGGRAKLNFPISLKVLIQNIGQGDAKGVVTTFTFPNPNCVVLGETDKFTIGNMKPGDSKEIDFIFTANRRYLEGSIPVAIGITEETSKKNHDTVVSVGLAQNLVAQNNVVISPIATQTVEVSKASLSSDVDKNIPSGSVKNPNKFALIIGNEEYSQYQSGLSTEANVAFARNDATVFREYVIRTLGFDESNVYFLTDATAGAMGQKIDLIGKMATKMGSQAELLFYYAGHGLPDEVTHIPYLIPVDVSATNLADAIPLSDIYKHFGETGAGKVTIFLDACFSGAGRQAGLLSARSVKIKPASESLLGNTVCFSASSGEQSALPFKKEKHGIFTYYLLKKIQESQGNITCGALADYLKKTVSIESLKVNQKEQDPTVSVSPDATERWEKWTLH